MTSSDVLFVSITTHSEPLINTSHEETVSYHKQAQAEHQERGMRDDRNQEDAEVMQMPVFKTEEPSRLVSPAVVSFVF